VCIDRARVRGLVEATRRRLLIQGELEAFTVFGIETEVLFPELLAADICHQTDGGPNDCLERHFITTQYGTEIKTVFPVQFTDGGLCRRGCRRQVPRSVRACSASQSVESSFGRILVPATVVFGTVITNTSRVRVRLN
jgi:hypothetical protein